LNIGQKVVLTFKAPLMTHDYSVTSFNWSSQHCQQWNRDAIEQYWSAAGNVTFDLEMQISERSHRGMTYVEVVPAYSIQWLRMSSQDCIKSRELSPKHLKLSSFVVILHAVLTLLTYGYCHNITLLRGWLVAGLP
jgi:hypothetical protein